MSRAAGSLAAAGLAMGAGHRVQHGAAGIEVERVAELVGLGGAAGLDAGGHVAGVVPAGAGVPQRAEQIAQRAEAEEVEGLVGHLELDVAGLAVALATARLGPALALDVELGRRRDVAGLLHPLHELLDQLVELLLGGRRVVAEQLLQQVVGQQPAVQQRIEDGVVQRLHGPIAVQRTVAVRTLEPARQQHLRQRRHEFFHVDFVGQARDVFAVLEFHGRCGWGLGTRG